MATDQSFVDHVLDQVAPTLGLVAKKMFGEYGLFLSDKMVALICDDQLFVKPTPGGRGFLGPVTEGSPYQGAKPCFLIEDLDDRERLTELLRITARELPAPKPKKKKL